MPSLYTYYVLTKYLHIYTYIQCNKTMSKVMKNSTYWYLVYVCLFVYRFWINKLGTATNTTLLYRNCVKCYQHELLFIRQNLLWIRKIGFFNNLLLSIVVKKSGLFFLFTRLILNFKKCLFLLLGPTYARFANWLVQAA